MTRDIDLRGASRRDFIKAVMTASAVLGLGPTRALEVLDQMGGSALAADAIDACYTVNLVAGGGSFAWWTMLWPVPQMLNNFNGTTAYDDKAKAVKSTLAEGRELWTRIAPNTGGQALWANHPGKQVTAMLCGQNVGHEGAPVKTNNSNTIPNGVGGALSSFGAQAILQSNIKSVVPVLSMKTRTNLAGGNPGQDMPYRRLSGGPNFASVANNQGMVGLFSSAASRLANRLKITGPDTANCNSFKLYYNALLSLVKTHDKTTYQRAYGDSQVAVDLLCQDFGPQLAAPTATINAWAMNSTDVRHKTLAEALIITANAFKLGLASQVNIPVLEDDPHTAFNTVSFATTNADIITNILQNFMDELATINVPGTTAKISDYVVMTVTGDLPKNSYRGRGTMFPDWADATFANANWIYVMSNGFLKPGWFGKYVALTTSTGGKVNFDGATGQTDKNTTGGDLVKRIPADPGTADTDCTNAALAGMLYAVARGNTAKVRALVDRPYEGLINK